jgi:hypothetical protein
MQKLFSMSEVGRLSMTAPHRIAYALNQGKIKEPRRLNGRRCFSEKDVEIIKEYFSQGNIYKVRVSGGDNVH